MKIIRLILISCLLTLSINAYSRVYDPIIDSMLSFKIQKALQTNESFKPNDIKIDIKDGVVFMQGSVENEKQALNIMEFCQSLNGVSDIDINQLTIKNNEKVMQDLLLTAKAKGLITKK